MKNFKFTTAVRWIQYSLGDLSSRSPLNTGWRIPPPLVFSMYFTAQTSTGATHTADSLDFNQWTLNVNEVLLVSQWTMLLVVIANVFFCIVYMSELD